ncbi:larval cuticle protein A3A [Folsomia candida]|uniref:Larval cuticle protein A2B n=1 Tax=Folsomia candida TaxID=158441 RepID=A0A226DYA5_FOLCA|nr:larval cuticle protein A3A [Folsomia candida]OXA50018.1 Larval cuticle protein A2B [Folsomia candida]
MNKIVFLALVSVASAGIAPNGGHAYATSQLHHSAPVATYAHAAPLAVAHAAPVATYAHAAPVATYAHAAPVAVAHAAPVAHYAPAPVAVAKAVAVRAEPFDPHPQYNYGYSVSDGLTGDHHSAQESRDGDLVQGQYSLVEPDGAIRTVTYTADGVNGFNAVVNRQAPQVAVAKAVVAAPVAHHVAPVATYAHAPVAHAVAHHAVAAPVAYGGIAHHAGVYHH